MIATIVAPDAPPVVLMLAMFLPPVLWVGGLCWLSVRDRRAFGFGVVVSGLLSVSGGLVNLVHYLGAAVGMF
ncbi:MAG: hypothetical protein ACYTGQ_13375, partial [Planctomycetota bacterium]